MAGIRKHGAHRQNLSVVVTAATAAVPAMWTYDAFAAQQGGTTVAPVTGFDQAVEQITEMSLILSANLTGQVTNFTTFQVTHRNAAASTVDQIQVVASTTAYIFVAYIPANLVVASGATIPGGGTGTLTLATGSALPWTLAAGDSISFETTKTGNGQYAGGASLNFFVQQKGA